jgi:hypothetical protein
MLILKGEGGAKRKMTFYTFIYDNMEPHVNIRTCKIIKTKVEKPYWSFSKLRDQMTILHSAF